MPLPTGTRIAAYEILAPLGAGGMGEVYRALDTTLKREVAVKILPDLFSSDPERLARFEREAQVLASLDHPNIAQVHGLEASGATRALVMELVGGETLAERLARGPIPPDEALAIAMQIADGLEGAHERGIVHRDLKPANIKVREDGTVKILDFGLAKALAPATVGSGGAIDSPTTLAGSTELGTILGTPAYMAPEQARGRPVDRRADIWAFGAVFYEMVTGRRTFPGETVSDTIAAVLTGEPDWHDVPPDMRRLLQRCLEKDPKRRLRDIGDARLVLADPIAPPAPARRSRLPWAVAVAAVCALGAALVWLWPRATDRPLMRFDVALGPGIPSNALSSVTFSPDGRRLVFPVHRESQRVLATRLLGESSVAILEGTTGGDQPFFSPDGQWVGFYADQKLKKVSVQGGSPITLCDAYNARGASWGRDDTIVAALVNTRGLWRVPAAGGEPQPLTTLRDGELTHRWPQVLPGDAVLFTANAASLNSYEDASIDVVLASGERKTLWRGGYFGRFIPTEGRKGILVYIQRGVLFGVRFDAGRLEIEGAPAPLLQDVASDPSSGAGRFDYSGSGIFAYRSGGSMQSWQLAWADSTGAIAPLLTKPSAYYSPRFSPDGSRLAVSVDSGKGMDLFIHEFEGDTLSRLTFSGQTNADPVWAPDGTHLAFRSLSAAGWHIQWIRADGAGGPQVLLTIPGEVEDLSAKAISPDGRWLIYSTRDDETSSDLWILPLDLSDPDRPHAGKPEPFLQVPAAERRPGFSPDGRWIVYASNESGTTEVYVRAFRSPGTAAGGKWQISTAGGDFPIWSKTAREIFFQTPDNRLMVAEYTVDGGSFRAARPRLWSPRPLLTPGFTNVDLAPDGKRVAVISHDAEEFGDAGRVTFLLNFGDELRRR